MIKRIVIFSIMFVALAISSCTNNNSNVSEDYAINPETGDTVLTSTAYCQATIGVSKDVKRKGLDETITIKFGSSKCTSSKNVTPGTINSSTDNCVASWKTDGGSNPFDPSDCMYHDSYVHLEFYNSTNLHVGTVYFYESNSSSYKLKSSQGENGYEIVTTLVDNPPLSRNSTWKIAIQPSVTIDEIN